jgi:hypothetical protein
MWNSCQPARTWARKQSSGYRDCKHQCLREWFVICSYGNSDVLYIRLTTQNQSIFTQTRDNMINQVTIFTPTLNLIYFSCFRFILWPRTSTAAGNSIELFVYIENKLCTYGIGKMYVSWSNVCNALHFLDSMRNIAKLRLISRRVFFSIVDLKFIKPNKINVHIDVLN